MYRILEQNAEVKERREQARHPAYAKPELLATDPNQLWSWDITKLRGPAKWSYYYLYVIVDGFSRDVVGWLIAEQQSETLAKELVVQSCAKQEILPAQLTLHPDRGPVMPSKPLALLLADLGLSKTHSRPYTANDNPFSEAQFKTLKYRPDYPDRFDSLQAARQWAQAFFPWYNHDHHHTALGLMTPAMLHYGQVDLVQAQRQQVLQAAYAAHPERFVKGMPVLPELPTEVWINKPQSEVTTLPKPKVIVP